MKVPPHEYTGRAYETTRDLTVGVEEEFQILDAKTLTLTNRFEELREALPAVMGPRSKGELISSEIEAATVCCIDAEQVREQVVENRHLLLATAERLGLALAASGAHPFSAWQEQKIIDTPHYDLVEGELGYVAWRNNTFSLHVHVGVAGRERAIALTNAFRSHLPALLALSASSPFYEGRLTKLHSIRSQLFTKNFPRCGIPDHYEGWADYADYLEFLYETGSIQEATQIWWSVRPHLAFGTVEVRICDAQPRVEEALALTGLIVSLAGHLLRKIDNGWRPTPVPRRYLEEDFWRAIRYGLTGSLIDLSTRREVETTAVIAEWLNQVEDSARRLGYLPELDGVADILKRGNSAMRQIARHQAGEDLAAIQHSLTEETSGKQAPVFRFPQHRRHVLRRTAEGAI